MPYKLLSCIWDRPRWSILLHSLLLWPLLTSGPCPMPSLYPYSAVLMGKQGCHSNVMLLHCGKLWFNLMQDLAYLLLYTDDYRITTQLINSLKWQCKPAKSSLFILISCFVKIINKMLPEYRVFFKMLININKHWESCAPSLTWHCQSVIKKKKKSCLSSFLHIIIFLKNCYYFPPVSLPKHHPPPTPTPFPRMHNQDLTLELNY